MCFCRLPGSSPLALTRSRIRRESPNRLGKRPGRRLRQPGILLRRVFAHATGGGRDQRQSRRHRFERRQAERLPRVRVQKRIRISIQVGQRLAPLDVAEQMDPSWRPAGAFLSEPLTQRAVAGDSKVEEGRTARLERVDRVDEQADILLSAEPAGVKQKQRPRVGGDLAEDLTSRSQGCAWPA